jgi:cellobiose epimerase
MKKIQSVIVVLFITANFLAGQMSDPEPRLVQMKNEVHKNLTQNLLPYWSERAIDNVNGGFYGRIDANDKVFPDEDKGGIMNARILWTYSSAYRVLKDTSYLRLATHSRDYILAHFIDKEFGGAYRSVTSTGEPADTRKQTYTQAFFIYGLAEYYRATGDEEALVAAKNIFELLEKHALDKEHNGYFEVFTRDWKRSPDLLIGESTVKDEKTMNTSLHLMEAYANLYRVWSDKRMAERLKNLAELFLDKIIDKKTYHLINFMDRYWNSTSAIDSYGHDIEASWLLYEAAHLLGDPYLTERVKVTSIKMAETVEEAIQPDGSIVYEKDNKTGHVATNRSWWAQVEAIVGYLNAFELSGKEKFLDYSVNCWNYTRDHMVDNVNGGWYPSVSEKGIVGKSDKAGFWIGPYHNGRMCLEVIERVSSQLSSKTH